MIKFHCPHCDVKISAELSDVGVTADCPSCGQGLVVPDTPVEGGHGLQQIENVTAEESLSPVPREQRAQGRKSLVRFAIVATVLILLISTGAFIGLQSSEESQTSVGTSVEQPKQNVNQGAYNAYVEQPKQNANQGAYNAYMEGYDDPERGDVAELMIDRFSGGDRQAALLMILGAEDRRKSLPIRYVVVEQ